MSENERQKDPLRDLRRADPAHLSPAPSESRARIWARIQEATMDGTRSTSRRRLALLLNPGTAGPVRAMTREPGSAPASRRTAPRPWLTASSPFDGTVAAIDGDDVTFSVNEAFAGEASAGSGVTLSAPGMSGTSITSAGGPTLTIGARYLVAGDGEFVWACGFTQPYDQAVAAEWAEATR